MRKSIPPTATRLTRTGLLLCLLLALPALSQAWYVNAKTSPATGLGTIAPTGNTYVAGTIGTSVNYVVNPAPGYAIGRVTLDGLSISPAATQTESGGNVLYHYVVPYAAGKSWRYIVAYFSAAAGSLEITVNPGPNGGIRESYGQPLSGIPAGANRTLLIFPFSGYRIETVTATNTTPVDNGDGTQSVIYTNLQASQSVAATFSLLPQVTANAGSDVQTAGNGPDFTALLDGSRSTSSLAPILYAWTGPPELVFATPEAAATSVYSDFPGIYTATLTITAGGYSSTDTALVNVPSRAAFLENYCSSCHQTRDPDVMAAYGESKHRLTGPPHVASCQACHDPDDSKHYTVARPTGVCQPCHALVPSSTHATEELAPRCLECHDPHSTAITGTGLSSHFGGAFDGSAAQYVSQGAACSDCHADGDFSANAGILAAFAASDHADVTSQAWITTATHDWPVLANCRRCHSTIGYLDTLTGSGAGEAGQAGQILACNACHASIATGEVRPSEPVAVSFLNSQNNRRVLPDAGPSNICIHCHSGRSGGSTIKESSGDFSDLGFIDPHYLAATTTLYKSGYEFAGPTYANLPYFSHGSLGLGNGGPCAACHMYSPEPHLFQAVARGEDGAITAITSSTCFAGGFYCHSPSSFTPSELAAKEDGYRSALQSLETQLKAMGIHFHPVYPYFYTLPYDPAPGANNTPFRNWEGVWPGKGKDVMGSAFNLHLLRHEPGGYAHNSIYSRRLIFDALDFLADGIINGGVAIDPLVGPDGLDQTTAAAAKLYLDSEPAISGVQRP